MRTSAAVALAVALLTTLVALPSSAFCRRTTAGGDQGYDAAAAGRCAGTATALPLYWRRSCLRPSVAVDAALEARGTLTPARANAIVRAASEDWARVRCGAEGSHVASPQIHVLAAELNATCSGGEGVVEIQFSASPTTDGLFATTDLVFDANTGAITRARMTLYDLSAVLPPDPVESDRWVARVVRHEMGHALGLAHSTDEASVMYAGYAPSRDGPLTADEVAGLCDAYGPDAPIGAGCSTRPRPDDETAWPAVLTTLLALVAARRRARVVSATLLVSVGLLFAATSARAESQPLPSIGTARAAPKPRPARRRDAGPKRGAAKPELASPREPETEDAALLRSDTPTLGGEAPTLAPHATTEHAASPASPAAVGIEAARGAPASVARPRSTPADTLVGARYRASFLPRDAVGLLARTNRDLLLHAAGLELESRSPTHSWIYALSYSDLSTGNVLVGSTSSDLASSLHRVRSDLRAVGASVAFVRSFAASSAVSFEVGAELGLAVTFGSLVDSWVYESPAGSLSIGGRTFEPCRTVNDGVGCRPQDHADPTTIRVDGHRERGIFDGGRLPTLLPSVTLPSASARIRLGEGSDVRVGVGLSLTGIVLGVSISARVATSS